MFGSLDTSASALVAQRINLTTIAGNIANMNTTRTRDAAGHVLSVPYRRRVALFAAGNAGGKADRPGVHVTSIVEDSSPFREVYDPGHPDAIKAGAKKGVVLMPNVEVSTEMVNAMMAARVYEANVTAMEVTKSMAASSLRLLA